MITVAILGLGNRGRIYGKHFCKNKDAKIVALCDKNTQYLNSCAQKWKVPSENAFESDQDFFDKGKLADVLVIATQDRDHYRHAMAALALGYNLMLEKPVSPNYEETYEIFKRAQEKSLTVVVCHVLRYATYYNKIKEIIDSGEIGKVRHVNHTENIGYWHFAHSYVRGNWRREEETSPSILAKCCHDFDMIYYLTRGKAVKATSTGELRYFTPENKPHGAPDYCMDGCPHAKGCPYEARKCYYGITWHTVPFMAINAKLITKDSKPTLKKLKNALRKGPYGRCVFACDNNVMENQTVLLSYDNGCTATLTMTAFSRKNYRKIHIYGEKGEIFGNDIDGKFTLNVFAKKSKTIRVSAKTISMHGMSDGKFVNEFIEYMKTGIKKAKLTLIEETLESHKAAMLAERSRVSGKTEMLQ